MTPTGHTVPVHDTRSEEMPATHHGIIVGVDGSPAARVAVDWAAREAALRHRPLTLVHVVPWATLGPWHDMPVPVDLEAQFETQGREILREARLTAEEAIKEAGTITVDTELVNAGVLPALVDWSKGADMIVVGCRGVGALGRLLGSVSRGLLHHAHCPVAVIHDEDPLMPTPAMAPVVVGIDGSPVSEAATEIAFEEASRRGVELVAVHATSDFAVAELPGVDWSDVKKQAEQTLAQRLAGWQQRYPEVTVRRVVVPDKPTHQLLEQSESAQLTVVGSHGRGGFAGMLLGSVSTAVAESARMPVIVARPA